MKKKFSSVPSTPLISGEFFIYCYFLELLENVEHRTFRWFSTHLYIEQAIHYGQCPTIEMPPLLTQHPVRQALPPVPYPCQQGILPRYNITYVNYGTSHPSNGCCGHQIQSFFMLRTQLLPSSLSKRDLSHTLHLQIFIRNFQSLFSIGFHGYTVYVFSENRGLFFYKFVHLYIWVFISDRHNSWNKI